MPLTPGTRIGPYEVIALIGEGGMGEVWRAHHTALKRDDALKVLPDAFDSDPERLARFRRESQVLASLNHPNIAHVYGLEQADGVRALVMELVAGPTLADRIATGPIPLDEALPIAKQIAEGLEAAHERGIVHRDLKPANIKVREDGTVKILDFGLAKALEPQQPSSLNAAQSPTITTPAMMTGVGAIMGTAAYMSPEQAKGRPADNRSDLWAFGCVLFEMLTGRRPFDGEDVGDTLAAVLRAEPDWSALPADVPVGLRVLLQRCLIKDRRQRIAHIAVAQFVLADPHALASTRRDEHIGAPTQQKTGWRSPALLVGVGLALTAIVGGIAAWMTRPANAAPRVVRSSFKLSDNMRFTGMGRHAIAISPDGGQFVYGANQRFYLRSLSDFESRAIAGIEALPGTALNDPTFSPDGRSIAFYQNGAVRRVAASGGTATAVCATDPVFGMVWTADGILIGQGSKGVVRCPSDGGSPQLLMGVNVGEEASQPQLLPGGKAFLVTISKVSDGIGRWEKARVAVQPIPSGAQKTLIEGGTDARYLRTGQLVYESRGALFAVPFDLARLAVVGSPVSVVDGIRRSGTGQTGAAQFDISDDGTLVYMPGPNGDGSNAHEIVIADRAGNVTKLPVAVGAYAHVRSSRDGRRLAIGTDDGQDASVWIYDLSGSTAMRRLTLVGHNRFPIWSPDGLRVAFQSDREGDLAIFSQRADGAGAAERLTRPAEMESHIPESWNADGKHLSFAVDKSGYSLRVLSLDDGTSAAIGPVRSVEPPGSVFSPNGRWLAYYSSPRLLGGAEPITNRGVFVQPFPPTGELYEVPKVAVDYQPVWTADGKELIYVPSAVSGQLAAVGISERPTLTFTPPTMAPARATLRRLSNDERAYDVLPDGRFVGFLSLDNPSQSDSEIRIVTNWFEELKQRMSTK